MPPIQSTPNLLLKEWQETLELTIAKYHTDNGIYTSKAYVEDLVRKN